MRIQKVQASSHQLKFGGKQQIMGREAIRLIPSSMRTPLEENIARLMEIIPSPTEVKKFANGETYVNILEDMDITHLFNPDIRFHLIL